ncbi:acyl-CoA dehydrogenase family protein [Mesorhizobium australicum]|uniref:Acyl-CoA dehydrogenase n=1 Tax=Mesorhizobium australicum TaxID=536018 RepID=A0A1X7PWD5_9HYPH|nr:acyl-CoA dehydrogenase family protein [Mesorhizobium australicum]SMH56467.1 acyl-CoA dehydrogenase [Mesorhizobium australicum]
MTALSADPSVENDGRGYMTSERRMIQQVAREFTRNEVLPVANRLDPEKGEIPMDLRRKMAEMGYFGILVPEQYGGLGLGYFEYCLIAEELARGWMSVASIIARGQGSFLPKKGNLTDAQADRLRRAAQGDYLAAAALSEPGTGSDLASISCRAVKDGDEWVITGSKYWCTFADGADFLVVFARTSPPPSAAKRHLGISAFVIDKERGTLPTNCAGSPIPKIGYFGWNTFELSFQGTRVPGSALLGEEGKAFYLMTSGLEGARAHTAARSIGLAQAALDDAIAYAGERRQFGMPITEFQSLRFRIAEMATRIEACRQLMYFVCNEIDQGRRCDRESSMVKYLSAEMAERVTSDALQILGGAGYTKLHAVERHWRDARLTKIFEGTSEIQLRIISDSILGRSETDRRMVDMAFGEA